MKKSLILLISALLLITSVILSGCSGSTTPADGSDNPNSDASANTSTPSDNTSQPEDPAIEYFDETKQLINLQTAWKYLDNGTDPSPANDRTSWTNIDFDDSSWKTNGTTEAVFGAKAGALADLGSGYIPKVLLTHYQADKTCVPTYFFRGEFSLDKLPVPTLSLVGTLLYDDAAIVYLNGTRIAAFDEPADGFATNLSYGGSGNVEPKTVNFSVDPSLLKIGKNILAVEIHNQRSNSSDVYFSLPDFSIAIPKIQSLAMNVGADESKRNFTWYLNSKTPGTVQVAIRNGDEFPTEYSEFTSTPTPHTNTYIHRATIENLLPGKEYVYRIVNGKSVSRNYYFTTDATDSFNFIFVGDPQIGASWGAKDDAGEWAKTLNLATTMFPKTSLLVSAGDQVEVGTNEENYSGFLSPEIMGGLAIATTVGNHDTDAPLYTEHFNNPNTTINGEAYGATAAGSDYWYSYNNALFIHLNANNLSIAEHKAFMEWAISQNLSARWKIVVMHHAIFGAGPYYNEAIIGNVRNLFAPMFEEFDIDVVLSGHEHVYARAYMIENGFTPYTYEGVQSAVHDPKGILYLTGSSSSGSKYYDILDDASTPHIAVKEKNVTTFSNVEITADSFKITTYRVKDKSVLDSFEITKDPIDPDDMPESPKWLEDIAESVSTTDFSMMLNTSYAGGALTAITYGGEHKVVGIKDTEITLHTGSDVLKLENGTLTAIKEGTATVSFSYTAQMTYGSTYKLSTQPVTVTVTKGDKLCLGILTNAAKHISPKDYSEERYNQIQELNGLALSLLQKVNADNNEISEICKSLSTALNDYCIDKVVSKNAPYTTTEPNYHSFSDSFMDDGKRLTDGRKQTADPTVNRYAAWKNEVNPVTVIMDLGENAKSNTYTVYSVGGFWGVKNCVSVTVYGSDDGTDFTLISNTATVVDCGNANLVDESVTTLNAVTLNSEKAQDYRYIKFEISVNGNFLWIDEVEAKLVVGTPMETE